MKRLLVFLVAICSVLLGAWSVLRYSMTTSLLDIDFGLRFNETCSALQGVDPFLIWKGVVSSEAYAPWNFCHMPYYQFLPMVNGYSPWSYAIMAPLAIFDQETAAAAYRVIQLVCLAGVYAFVLFRLRRQSGNWWWPCVGFAALCWAASDAFTVCLIVGNYGVISTVAAFGAIRMHERGCDELAGLCWFFALLKPQLGGLFILTLLLERKWRTLLVTALLLAVATSGVAWLCGRNPISMVLCVGESGLGQFPGTGLIPAVFYWPWVRLCGERIVLACSAIVGIAGCVVSWWQLRNHSSVWVRFLPASVLSVVWLTYRGHDFSIHLLVSFTLLTLMWRAKGLRLGIPLALFVAVSMRLPILINVTWLVCCNYVSFVLLVLASVVTGRCNRIECRGLE